MQPHLIYRLDNKTLVPLNKSTVHLLHLAHQRAADLASKALRAYGLTVRQYAVLLSLRNIESTTQTVLIQKTGIDRSTLGDMLTRMEQRELVVRNHPETDKRINQVTITPKGLRALQSVIPKVAEAEKRILAPLCSEDRDLFLESLKSLTQLPKN